MGRSSFIHIGTDICIFSAGLALLMGITTYLVGVYEKLIAISVF